MPTALLQSSMPPYIDVATVRASLRAPCLQTSSMLLHLQRASRASYLLHVATPTAHPPDLYTSVSLRLQRASRARYLYTSMSASLHACGVPPELDASTPSDPQRASKAPCLHVYTPTCLQFSSRARYLHISTSLQLERASGAPCLQTSSMLLHLQRASRASYLLPATTPTAHPPNLYTSVSLRLQRASSAPYLQASTSTRLQLSSRAHTSIPPRRYS